MVTCGGAEGVHKVLHLVPLRLEAVNVESHEETAGAPQASTTRGFLVRVIKACVGRLQQGFVLATTHT